MYIHNNRCHVIYTIFWLRYTYLYIYMIYIAWSHRFSCSHRCPLALCRRVYLHQCRLKRRHHPFRPPRRFLHRETRRRNWVQRLGKKKRNWEHLLRALDAGLSGFVYSKPLHLEVKTTMVPRRCFPTYPLICRGRNSCGNLVLPLLPIHLVTMFPSTVRWQQWRPCSDRSCDQL